MKKFTLFIFTMFNVLYGIAQTNITVWDFNANSATPTVGSGTLTNLGGITFTYASGTGSSDPATTDFAYNTTTYPAQNTAPKTAGVQVAVSTAGFQNISFSFDQRLSNTANNTYVVQYTTDITAPVPVWTDAQVFTFTPAPTGTGDTWYNLRNTNLSAITALNNNPNAAFRVVSDFDPIAGTYLAARSTSTYGTGGTSRFDMITVNGDAIVPPTPFQIEFAGNDKTISENAGTTSLKVVVTSAGNTAATVDVAISAFSNTTNLLDYTIANATLTIPANAQTGDTLTIPIDIIDDAIIESDEYIVAKFSNGMNANFLAADQYVIYIKDNDKLIPAASNKLNLELVTSFSNGPSGSNSAEIVAFDSLSKRLFIANSIGAKLNIVSFTNPAAPSIISTIDISAYGNINSVAAKNGIIAMAIENSSPQQNGYIVFLDTNGVFLSQVNAGAMPDMIIFNHSGTKVYTANEGEPNAAYTNDPEGSVTVADLSAGVLNASSINIPFTSFNPQAAALRAQGIRIYGPNATVAQDFEPEYITISDDDQKAWVSLQENNAMAEIDLLTNTVTTIYPLGYKNHNLAENSMDVSNTTTGINSAQYPVKGMYLPDAIAQYTDGGNVYVFSANEGDAREYAGYSEVRRISAATYTLDNTIFPNATEMKNNSLLGRLNISSANGDTDNDGDFDEIYVYGARSFSVWNMTTGCTQVYDSKNELELITENHPTYGNMFNASNGAGITIKDRSDDKGPEPEGVTIGKVNSTPYVFIALERIGGVMAYDITNPTAPQYVTYKNNRGPDLGSEGIVFISSSQSPDGNNYVILANEISSTLSIYKVEENCSGTPTAGTPVSLNDTICLGGIDTISSTITTFTRGVTYQWQEENGMGWMNVAPGNGDTTLTYITQPLTVNTQFRLIATCTNSNESDTTDIISVVVNPLPVITVNVSANNVCEHTGITLTATGTDTYVWSNGISNGVPFVANATTTYTVTATDINGCSNTATETITVNPASADISLALPLNTASASGTVSDNKDQPLNAVISYYSGSCNLIATITENGNAMGNTAVTTTVENAIPVHNGQPFVQRWFEVMPATNTNAKLYLYFTQNDFDTYNVYATANNWPLLPASANDAAGIANVRITKNDNAGLGVNPLVLTPDSIAFDNVNNYWIVGMSTPSFSQFRIHAANPGGVPLPVSWLSFNIENTGNAHILNWATANEMNSKQFTIEQSADGIHFNALAIKDPESDHNYSHSNTSLLAGNNYYRIVQQDVDGKLNVSETLMAYNGQGAHEVTVYPNPMFDKGYVEFYTTDAQNYALEIYDLSGRMVSAIAIKSDKGLNRKEISVDQLKAGVYTAILRGKNSRDILKIIKK